MLLVSKVLGGVLGGKKYVASGILFKIASSRQTIFGRDADIMAAKISGHDLVRAQEV